MENNNNKNIKYDLWCDMIDYDASYNTISKSIASDTSNSLVKLDNHLSNSLKLNIFIDNSSHHDGQNLSIDEIMKLNYEQISELCLVKHQSYVTLQLKKYVSNCKNEKKQFNVQLHIEKIKWLLKTITFLSNKHKLHEIKIKKNTDKTHPITIKRNSYAFCENNSLCVYHKNLKCKKKHFVYNYTKCDIEELINYIENSVNISIEEICTSINTISYVINHMKDELYHVNNI
jgi:hypothetical protein